MSLGRASSALLPASMSPNGEKDRLRTTPSCCNTSMLVRTELTITPRFSDSLFYKVINESASATAKYELEGERTQFELVNSNFRP